MSGRKLFPYQEEGVKRILTKSRVLLSDTMGLGKSSQAITATCVWKERRGISRVLVVCPACLIYNWQNEFQMWDKSDRAVFVFSPSKKQKYRGEDVVISSYDSFNKVRELIGWEKEGEDPFVLIADEFHYCKNWEAQRTRDTITVSKRAARFIAITGTPMTVGIPDLHSIVCAITGGGMWGTYEKFCETYSNKVVKKIRVKGGGERFVNSYEGVKNLEELREKMSTFMIRRYKEDVLPELPEKIFTKVMIEVDPEVVEESCRDEYLQIVQEEMDGRGEEGSNELGKESYATMRKNLGISKINGTVEYLKTLLEGGYDNLVVFAYHRDVVEGIRDKLLEVGIKTASIIGGDSAEYRQGVVDKFQAGELQVVVLSVKAASVGITLTRANYVYFAEYTTVPADMAQAVDRCHRIGQDRGVIVAYGMAKGSLDEYVYVRLMNRMKVIGSVL